MAYILVYDAGTGSVRAVLFNQDGEQVIALQEEWVHEEDPRYPGSMNFNTEKNWGIIKDLTKRILAKTQIDPGQIKAISATSMREGFVLVNAEGKEIWACANVDARATEEVVQLKTSRPGLEDALYKKSGQTLALGAIPRLHWIQTHQPEIYEQAAGLVMLNDWILFKLTHHLQVDPSNGCTTGLFDLEKRTWSSELATECGIKPSLLPKVNEASTSLGGVTPLCAAETGLREGTPVFCGGGDAQMASIGVGAINENETFICGGSFWQQMINTCTPSVDDQCRIRVNCHAVKDLWQLEAIAFVPGLVMRWFRDAFCDLEKMEAEAKGIDVYDLLEEKAKDVPVGSNGIISIFSDVMNFKSWRHASPSFLNLNFDHYPIGKKELFRSIQENAALVTLGNLLLIKEATGYFPDLAIFAGGASKGKLWSQTLADVLGIPIKVPVIKEASALGTALMAGVGAGLFENIDEAVKQAVKWERLHTPDLKKHQAYLSLYERWKVVYKEQLKLADSGLTTPMWKAPGATY